MILIHKCVRTVLCVGQRENRHCSEILRMNKNYRRHIHNLTVIFFSKYHVVMTLVVCFRYSRYELGLYRPGPQHNSILVGPTIIVSEK